MATIFNLLIALVGGVIGHQISQRWIQRRRYRLDRARFKADLKPINDALDQLLSSDFPTIISKE